MDNIIFEKIWQDNELIEFKISAKSEFETAEELFQKEQVEGKLLLEIWDDIKQFF